MAVIRVERQLSYATLIPSRGRSEILLRTLTKMPWLDDPDTYIGIQHDQEDAYAWLRKYKVRVVTFANPEGSVGIAREALRNIAVAKGYDYYIATDDNAKFSQEGQHALIQAAEAWRVRFKRLTFMCGMHSTASHFDRGKIEHRRVIDGWRTYPGIGFIFHCMPHAWYAAYRYPGGCFALEDRHMMLAAIDAGHREFRVCMDAPFSKQRYQPGGQGDTQKRIWNCGRAIEQLAHDFPQYVGMQGTLRLPWQMIMKIRDGAEVDRLPGGAMRKGEALLIKKLKARIHRTR